MAESARAWSEQVEPYRGLPVLQWQAYDEPGWDYPVFGRVLREGAGVGLELGVGAGRLLRRYLRDGLDVEGVDAAPEMLQSCRTRAAAEGLSPVLYEQAMQELDLPRRYTTVYVPCGSLAMLPDQEQLLMTLRRIHAHLLDDGRLVFNLEPVDHDYRGGGVPPSLPENWAPHVDVDLLDGRRLHVERRTASMDAVHQSWREERRYTLLSRDGTVEQGPEIHASTLRWLHVPEVISSLGQTGFVDVRVTKADLRTPYGPAYDGPVLVTAHRAP